MDTPPQLGPVDSSASAAHPHVGQLRVIARPAFRNRLHNPYNALIYEAMLGQGADVIEYYGGRWLLGQHDVFHVHWPESAFNHGLVGAWLNNQVLLSAMDRLRRRGTRCIWTAHNLEAHERRFPRAEARAWRAFTRRLDGFVSLTAPGIDAVRERFPELRDVPGFVVAHPHFRGAYPDGVSRSEARAALSVPPDAHVVAYLGRILEYKNVPELVRVFSTMQSDDERPLSLLVAGQPRTPRLAQEVVQAAARDSRVRLWLRHIASVELQLFLRAADLVVLPYREIFNSGSALLALSFDRPVLMPGSYAALDLRSTCGPEWLHIYEGLLTPQAIRTALHASHQLPERSDGAWLAARAPERIAAQTLAAYNAVIARPPRSFGGR